MYVGCVWQEYALYLEHARVAPTAAVLTGSGMNFMVGRVSYTFGLQGARPQSLLEHGRITHYFPADSWQPEICNMATGSLHDGNL